MGSLLSPSAGLMRGVFQDTFPRIKRASWAIIAWIDRRKEIASPLKQRVAPRRGAG